MLKIFFLMLSFFSISSIANETIMEVIPLHNRPASELQPLIRPLLEGSEQIIANGSNLIVKATPEKLKQLKTLIKKLDTGLSNLSITVVQSKTKTAHDLNAAAKIRLNIPLNKSSGLSGRISGRYANTEDLNKDDSTQVIRTLEGRTAFIKTGITHPVHNYSIYEGRFGHPIVTGNTQFIETTTGFLVTPRLTGNQVTMEITPWSDKINNEGAFETQAANTSIRVNLGEWVEIGGISEHSQTTRNGTLSHTYSTESTKMHILIKVDKRI